MRIILALFFALILTTISSAAVESMDANNSTKLNYYVDRFSTLDTEHIAMSTRVSMLQDLGLDSRVIIRNLEQQLVVYQMDEAAASKMGPVVDNETPQVDNCGFMKSFDMHAYINFFIENDTLNSKGGFDKSGLSIGDNYREIADFFGVEIDINSASLEPSDNPIILHSQESNTTEIQFYGDESIVSFHIEQESIVAIEVYTNSAGSY